MATPTGRPIPLLCPSDQVGRCARCQQPCHRYGVGANPLCQTCRQAVETARQQQKTSPAT
ncbi:hypothetical protein EYS09_07890 [Streptomyces kasugaensis]|uniref:Uncharacterized protein n=1 Tax=Streptomyces kasugaensis TaxID=1946 RepID=A0A4Q9HY98_STRKA|nr:hypothetical protein EYS09_07890 [Streptomyces kasugaensis]